MDEEAKASKDQVNLITKITKLLSGGWEFECRQSGSLIRLYYHHFALSKIDDPPFASPTVHY